MKRILLVVENQQSAKSMLEKAMLFSPEIIDLLSFNGSEKEASEDSFQTMLEEKINKQCQLNISYDSASKANKNSEKLTNLLSKNQFDMIMLHRPHLGKELPDFSMIKKILKSPTKAMVFLCGDNTWKTKIKVFSTIDMSDQSKAQQSLNKQVLRKSIDISEQLKAELEILSVITISRVSKELDVVEPSEVLTKNSKATKAKIQEFVKSAEGLADIPIHVTAGSPSSEIASNAKKLKANLVVLGNVGRTGIKGLVIGNTAEKILSRLTIDAVILKQ